ncbi:hypothetical protein [Microbulbifer sp. HZ11]|uniref:hypothetical protein n=1 Tax=Microbulbifer sp. HZ11 TaxID=1453501 RepID=UPI0005B953BA|nr:hypothetical protein [Microbulbifer sp. HZ11]
MKSKTLFFFLSFCYFTASCYSYEIVTNEDAYLVEDIDSKDLAALGIGAAVKKMDSDGWSGNLKVSVKIDSEMFDPNTTKLKVLLAGEDDLLAVIECFDTSSNNLLEVTVSDQIKTVLMLEVSGKDKGEKTKFLRFSVH